MGFWAVQRTASLPLAILVAAIAGAAMAAIHAFLVVTLRANQIVSGLALTIFAGAAGLSSYLGNDLQARRRAGARTRSRPFLPHSWQTATVVGPIFFKQSALVYASWVCVLLVALYLNRTRPGLNVRAVGESPGGRRRDGHQRRAATATRTRSRAARSPASAARASRSRSRRSGSTGSPPAPAGSRSRSSSSRSGGRRSASSARTSSARSPGIPFTFQARGILGGIPPELFQALPYVMTIVVLVLVSSAGARRRLGAPAALGTPYVREER